MYIYTYIHTATPESHDVWLGMCVVAVFCPSIRRSRRLLGAALGAANNVC